MPDTINLKYNIMNRVFSFLISFVLIVALTNCAQDANRNAKISPDTISAEPEVQNTENEVDIDDGSIPIFYNMYLTVEMSSLFESIDAVYEEDYINPASKTSEYIMSSEMATNLGVYAVDLSYVNVFEKYDKAGSYLSAMHQLSEDLGIPGDHFYETVSRFEDNINDRDSLYAIANEIYVTTDTYLNENGREGSAALIILGGWIEAMHIATAMVRDGLKDPVLLEKIADQSESLENLIELLEKHKENEIIAEYLTQLKNILQPMNSVTVDYDNPTPAIQQIIAIGDKISAIRNQIIN